MIAQQIAARLGTPSARNGMATTTVPGATAVPRSIDLATYAALNFAPPTPPPEVRS